MKYATGILFLLLFLPIVSATEAWTAHWITAPQINRQSANQWICFRKSVTIDQVPRESRVRIATDSKYWLWVNGKLVVFEGELKRGPTPTDTYYDEVDLAPALRAGKNTIALLSWYWGKDGFSHKNSGRAGMLLQGSIAGVEVDSDATWKAVLHPAYQNTSAPNPNYRLAESNVLFDAGKDMAGWQLPEYDDTGWPEATELCNAPCSPWNALWERPVPQWKFSDYLDYKDLKTSPYDGGTTYIGRLPQNLTVTPYLQIEAEAGLKLGIQTDNYDGGSENNVRAEYITRKGVQEYESLGYMNGHEVLYRVPQGVKVLALKYRYSGFDTQLVRSFDSDDGFYNILWRKAQNTMLLNMRDSIQDPDRERAQWWGDAVIVSGEMFYACDPEAQLLARKAISNLIEWRKPSGILYSPVPSGAWDKELPAQMLAAIGKYGFWNYYMNSADPTILPYVFPEVWKYLSLWQMDRDGLVKHRTGDWDWYDWGKNIDVPVLENAWYLLALQSCSSMARELGRDKEAAECERKEATIKTAFNRHFWNGSEYRSPSYSGPADDRGNALAVLAGVAGRSKWNKISTLLERTFNASPYMEKYVLESLFVMNNPSGALNRMKRRYRDMVFSPLTTLWEGWAVGDKHAGGGSYNHGWAGGPLILLSQYVAGVAPEEPGYATFHVYPEPGSLQRASAEIPTIRGTIKVEWNASPGKFEMKLHSPTGASARVGFPRIGSKLPAQLILNGKNVAGSRSSGEHPDFLVVTVQDGDFEFQALY